MIYVWRKKTGCSYLIGFSAFLILHYQFSIIHYPLKKEMKLNLKNPIVFFDLETTGTNINTDRIVEICYLKVYPNGNEEAKTLRINPEMHIPEASSAVSTTFTAAALTKLP